jgi:hypothetical protein
MSSSDALNDLRCKSCDVKFTIRAQFLTHAKLRHLSGLNPSITCPFKGCNVKKVSHSSIEKHIYCDHQNQRQAPIPVAGVYYICSHALCNDIKHTPDELLKHLHQHLRVKQKITCPFGSCDKTYEMLYDRREGVPVQQLNLMER